MTPIEQSLDILWNYHDPLESEKKFGELLKQEPNHQAEILTQIARAQGLQGKFEEAHTTLNSVKKSLSDKRINVRYLLERGRLYNSAKQQDKARPLFLEAYHLAKSIHTDFYEIDAAHMMAIIEPTQEQIIWHERCLELCEKTTDERTKKWQGSILNNAAWTFHDAGKFEEALEIFKKALVWQEQHGKPQSIHIAKWSVARCLRSLERFEEALDIQKRLVTEENPDGYVYQELGECLMALGQLTEAKPYFTKAYELLSQDSWFAQHEKEKLERLSKLA